jgi:drug/metabolite transporter (DMT)-like permease
MKFESRSILLTTAALVAFAGNSVLCRVALGGSMIDAATFSTIRLAAGAGMLLLVTASTRSWPSLPRNGSFRLEGSWISAAILFLYAVPFSFAYVTLTAGTGALILFGAVQVTMMVMAVRSGEHPQVAQWLGLALALFGLVYLVMPGLAAPPLGGSALMALAGIAWGIYSVRGRGAANPLAQTTSNFVRALPLAIVVSVVAFSNAHIMWAGALLAVASGALTSGLGYVLWYAALRTLTATRAAVVQLTVPILAGAAGILFLGETVSSRLVMSTAIVLGGIGLALTGGKRFG